MPTLLENTKDMIIAAFLGLPLMIIAYTFFIGFGLGNVGMIMLFVGHAVVIPVLTPLLHLLTGRLFNPVPGKDVCKLVPSAASSTPTSIPQFFSRYVGTSTSISGYTNIYPSYWATHVVFFASYLITNAVYLYLQDADANAPDRKVKLRKEQALTSIVVTSIVLLLILYARIVATGGCETFIGIIIALLAGGGAGFGWYYLASLCGIRASDVFGIAGRMIPLGAKQPPPLLCSTVGT
jgi:hypothetical protein